MKRALQLLFLLALAGSAAAQSNNLLRNANSDEGLQFWHVFGNTVINDCAGDGKCFSMSQDAFVYQDVEIAASPDPTYAVLIGFSRIEQPNVDAKQLGHPYLYGYFMDSTNARNAKIISNLNGQEMGATPTASGQWTRDYGIFKVAEGTRSIRIFMRSGCPKSGSSATCTSNFRRPGIFLFTSEEEANAFVSTYQ